MIWVYGAFLALCGILVLIEYFTGDDPLEDEDGKEMQ